MRRATLVSYAVLTSICGLVTGCQALGLSRGGGTPEPQVVQADTQAPDPAAADLAAQAEAQAQRIAQLSARQAPERHKEIIWRDIARGPAANDPIEPVRTTAQMAARQPQPVTNQASVNTVKPPRTTPVARETSAPSTTSDTALSHKAPDAKAPVTSLHQAQTTTALSHSQAYNQHLMAIRASEASNLHKAITAATLGAAGPYDELDWTLLAPLSPKDQERVQRYFEAITALRDQAGSGDGRIDQTAIAGKLDELFGNQPLSIRTIELCEKVLGYGVYDKFPERSFPAGREQKMIIYVELDNFQPSALGEGEGYEVRLRQELELYESGGYEVWSHEPVQIVDVSRNQRRDFFVVQLVTLPGQLALGQYHLKVRIYDENAGTRDEVSIPIQIVADDAMVRGRTK